MGGNFHLIAYFDPLWLHVSDDDKITIMVEPYLVGKMTIHLHINCVGNSIVQWHLKLKSFQNLIWLFQVEVNLSRF